MKFLKIWSFLFLICFVQTSCQDEVPVLFKMNFEEGFTIPAGLNTFTLHVFRRQDVRSFFSDQLQSRGLNESDIVSILPGKARFASLFQNSNFGVVDEVIVYLINPDDNSPRREVFFRENIPQNEDGELLLFGSLSEVKDLAALEKFDIELEFVFKWVTQQTIDMRFEFELVAKGE